MKKNSFLVKTVLMSIVTAATFTGFTSCTDELDTAPLTEETTMTRIVYHSDYNINDHAVIVNDSTCPAFDRKNWREEQAVFIYTAALEPTTFKVIGDKGTVDKQGYQLVNFPWSEATGTSYIPKSVINDLRNDPEWQLVMMQCGNESTRNGNYLGFYHKYRGVLRIMTYLKPGQLNKTNYLWGFAMGDELASHSVFGYALPEDKAASIEKVRNSLDMGEWMSKTVTPMMSKSKWDMAKGSMPAMEGWWSFDIDLSVYNTQNDVKSTSATDVLLSLHPLGYATTDYEFSSAMSAVASGNINMEQYQTSNDGEVVGSIMKGLDVIGKVADFAGKCSEGKVAEAISSGVDLAKTGCEIAGIGSKDTGYKGDIHLDMNGNITTSGKSCTGVIFDDMPAANLKLGNFDFDNNTLGQGVWNLETAPVVYCTNAETNWKEEENSCLNAHYGLSHFSEYRYTQIFGPVVSPFGGLYKNTESNGGKLSGKPWHGLVCFFDPSSVKVTLNPNVFKDSEIQSAQVTAVCGVRKGTDFSHYEEHRAAQQLQSAKRYVNSTIQFPNRYIGETPFNAFGRGVNQFSADPVDKNEVSYIGAGDSEYLIEPVALRGQSDTEWGNYYLPTYEVTVFVTIKLDNGQTLVLSRKYLPEIKDMNAMQVESYYNQLKDRKIGMPSHYNENVYNEQVARIGQLNHWMRSTPIATYGTPKSISTYDELECKWNCSTYEDHPLCTFSRLIDGDKNSKWASHVNNKYGKNVNYNFSKTVEKNCDHNCWFAEFKTYGNMKANGFTLTSSNTGDEKKPRSIRLFARNDNQGEWVQLYYQNNINMPTGANAEMTFKISSSTQGYYNTYRFEVVDNCGGLWLDLNELTMNWAE